MIISPDQKLVDSEGRYSWTSERVQEAWAQCRAAWEAALASGKFSQAVVLCGLPASGKTYWIENNANETTVYFDAVLKRRLNRVYFVDTSRRAGIPLTLVWLKTPLQECLERNERRSQDRKVPAQTIKDMHSWFAREPPSKNEGFRLLEVSGF